MKLKGIWALIKETFLGWHRDDASQLAAALAFYTVVSLAPTIIIVIAVSGLAFGKEEVQGQIVEKTTEWIGEIGAKLIQTLIASTSEHTPSIIATIVGVVTILLGATRLFVQLQSALNRIWGVKPKPGRGIKGIIRDRLLSFAILMGIGFLLLVLIVLSATLALLSKYFGYQLPTPVSVFPILDFIISTLLFATIYKVLPDVKIAWSNVWIGATVTSLLFTIGKFLIGLYLSRSGVASAYGAAGSLFVLLIWLYYSAQIFLLGAEFTQAYAEKYGSPIVPNRNAVRIIDYHTEQRESG